MVIDVLVCRADGSQTVERRTVADDYLAVTGQQPGAGADGSASETGPDGQ